MKICPICDKELVQDKEASWQLVCPTQILVYSGDFEKYVTHYLIDPKEPYKEYITEGFKYTSTHEIIIVMPYRLCNNFGNNTTHLSKWVDPNDPDVGFSYKIGARSFEDIMTIPLVRYSKDLEDRIKTFLIFS